MGFVALRREAAPSVRNLEEQDLALMFTDFGPLAVCLLSLGFLRFASAIVWGVLASRKQPHPPSLAEIGNFIEQVNRSAWPRLRPRPRGDGPPPPDDR